MLLLCAVANGRASEAVGSIKAVEGQAVILRDGIEYPVAVGRVVFQHDLIRTEAGASAAVVLRDDTLLSLGPESELSLHEYLFEPRDNRFAVVLRMLKGTFVYMSGVIGKLAPDSIRLETPDSTIAVRGTRLLIEVKP